MGGDAPRSSALEGNVTPLRGSANLRLYNKINTLMEKVRAGLSYVGQSNQKLPCTTRFKIRQVPLLGRFRKAGMGHVRLAPKR